MKNRRILAALVSSFALGLTPLAAEPVIHRGIDIFSTPAEGKSHYDFARNPIPAGFFCKRSKPFTGRVEFKGLPLATGVPGQLWATDTIVERLDDATFDANGRAVTRIQFRALSMVSTAPLKTACGDFHVYVSLNGPQRVTTMTIHRTKELGGQFIAPLAVDARMTFIPVKPAQAKAPRKLEMTGSFTFPAVPIPWTLASGIQAKKVGPVLVDTDGDLTPDTRLPGTSNFLPGTDSSRLAPNKWRDECPPCVEMVCHDAEGGKLHCYNPYPNCMLTLCSW